MRLASASKDGGGGQALWPRDVTSIEDLPYDLSIAIDQAYRICGWQENLQSDEMPPQWMWHLDWEIEAWFIDVQRMREEKYGMKSDDNYDSGDREDNEYAARFK